MGRIFECRALYINYIQCANGFTSQGVVRPILNTEFNPILAG